MGFFSWECAVSGKSIRNKHTDEGATPCVVVFPNGKTIEENDYDGYGVFGGVDVYEMFSNWKDPKDKPYPIKIVAKENYNGQKYADLPESPQCDSQGFFNW